MTVKYSAKGGKREDQAWSRWVKSRIECLDEATQLFTTQAGYQRLKNDHDPDMLLNGQQHFSSSRYNPKDIELMATNNWFTVSQAEDALLDSAQLAYGSHRAVSARCLQAKLDVFFDERLRAVLANRVFYLLRRVEPRLLPWLADFQVSSYG